MFTELQELALVIAPMIGVAAAIVTALLVLIGAILTLIDLVS